MDWQVEPDFLKRLEAEKLASSHNVEAAQGYFLGGALLGIAVQVKPPYAPLAIMQAMREISSGPSPAGHYYVKNSPTFGWHVQFPAVLREVE